MISIDTNVLLYALNRSCQEHGRARSFLEGLTERSDVILSELVLVELYLLLRNTAVVPRALNAGAAVEICETFRRNPRWRCVGMADVMDGVWAHAAQPGIARRRIIDTRLALSLRHHGVTDFATRNIRDFGDFGFTRVWDPIV